MFRKAAITTVAVLIAGAGAVSAQAMNNKPTDLVFASSMLKFDHGKVAYCNYGDDSMSAAFTSDKGHTLELMYEAQKGTITVTGKSSNTGVITNGKVDDRGTFLFAGILSDGVGKSADFTFSGACPSNNAPKPKPTPKPTELFNMTSGSGKYNFTGNKINNCVYGKNVVVGEFVGTKGEVANVEIYAEGKEHGKGSIKLKMAHGEKVEGYAHEAKVTDDGSFFLTGTLKVGMGDSFNFTGKCVKS